MNTPRWICILFVFPILAMTGCVVPKSMTVECALSTNLGGTLRITAHEVHSNAPDPEIAKTQMKDFIETELPGCVSDIVRGLRLQDEKLTTTPINDNNIDVTLEGKFTQVFELLSEVLYSEDFALSHINGIFELTLPSPQANTNRDKTKTDKTREENKIEYKLRYKGTVLEHNAESTEEDGKVLVWSLKYLDKEGLKIKLKTSK